MLRCLVVVALAAAAAARVLVVGPDANDVVRLLAAHPNATRSPDAAAALGAAAPGDAVLLLAPAAPARTPVPPGLAAAAAAGGFRAYVEFPDDGFPAAPRSWKDRVVVASSNLSAAGLDPLRILQLQDPVGVDYCAGGSCGAANASSACGRACAAAAVVFARVAGVDRAAYGLDAHAPLLFANGSGVLVAAAALSNVTTGRSAPADAWRALWSWVLGFPLPAWRASVAPAYAAAAPLPASHAADAVARSARWISDASGMMARQDRGANATYGCCRSTSGTMACALEACTVAMICPAPHAPPGVANVTCLQEGWSSIIHADGAQHMMPLFVRTDGNAAAAMALAAAAGAAGGSPAERAAWRDAAARLLDYLFRWSESQSFVGSNASDPTHGLVWWNQRDAAAASGGVAKWASVDYGSNAAVILVGATAAAGLLESSSWRERMLYALFAEARTTGRLGNRPGAVSAADLRANGWRHYFADAALPSGETYSPHYGAQIAAYFLFAGAHTGFEDLFWGPARGYARGAMASLRAGVWTWCQSMTNELATLLLTLAWLVRVDGTAEHRAWLDDVAGRLLAYQTAHGGIKQFFGAGPEAGKCSACVPASNAAYGDGEAPLMFDGDEPLTDSLYGLNFALIGLREAFGATGDDAYGDAEAALAAYLARIQASSAAHPELDGAWFRAFDYERWEYWASDSDWGYGPWVTDNGWTNGWIQTALALRSEDRFLWDVMADEGRAWDPAQLARICEDMLLDQAATYCVQAARETTAGMAQPRSGARDVGN